MNRWLLAARPKTLLLAISPVLMGTAFAYRDGGLHPLSALGCLVLALTIQIGTNLTNDYYDFLKGADTEDRLGPVRVMQAGLVRAQEMRIAMMLVFGISLVCGGLLCLRAGQEMMVIAALSVVCGVAYTAGPLPLAYAGIADLFVLIFFGPVAVAGTYYSQSLHLDASIIAAGWAPGLLATAVLVVNNVRDVDGDRRASKHTLPVRFGRDFGRGEYLACLLLAAFIPVWLVIKYSWSPMILVTLVLAPLAMRVGYTVMTRTDGPALNNALANTAKLQLLFGVLFSAGCLL